MAEGGPVKWYAADGAYAACDAFRGHRVLNYRVEVGSPGVAGGAAMAASQAENAMGQK